jgi:hypothetical protein
MTKRLKLTPPRVLCPVAARRYEIMERLEDERDLLCIGRPSPREIDAAWTSAGVGMTFSGQRVGMTDVSLTRRGLLGLRLA